MAGLFDHFLKDPRRQFEQGAMENRLRERLGRRVSESAAAMPEVPNVDTTVVSDRPRLAPVTSQDPYATRIDDQRRNTQTLIDTAPQVQNKDKGVLGLLGDIFKQFVISSGENYANSTGDPTQRLLGALGGGIAGGTYAGFNPEVDERRQRLYDINRSQQQEGVLEQQRAADQRAQLTQAQINTIPIDDEINRMKVRNAQEQDQINNKIRVINNVIRKGKIDPKDKLQAEALRLAGIDPTEYEGFDYTNPLTKQVAGETYTFNNTTRSFEPAKGIKPDESKAIVDYVVELNGETHKFRVPQKDAASFTRQMAAVNAKIASDEKIAGQRIASTEKIADKRIEADRTRQDIRLKMQAAVKEYETAVAEKKAAVATQAKILLMDLQKQLDAVDELDDQ